MMSKTAAEPLVRISKREGTTFVQKVLVRAIAILLALVVDAFFIFFVTGLNPISVYGVMWNGTFMNTTRFSWALRDLSSLLCIAIALAPAFKMRFWNIGGEGQVLIGGLVAALIMVYFGSSLPAPLLFAAMVIGSVLAGAIWAFVPAWFKSRWNTNETLFTLMMNYVATSIVACMTNIMRGQASSLGTLNKATKAGWLPVINGQRYTINIIVVLVLTFGFTLLTSDIAIGRRTKQSAIRAYETMRPKWKFLGILTFLVPVLIMTYYAVIGGWITKYAVVYLTGQSAAAAEDGYFTSFITSPVSPVVFALLFMGVTAFIVYNGVEGGIERVSRYMMPILLVLVVVIAGYALTLRHEDASGQMRTGLEGLRYYLTPHMEGLTVSRFLQILLDAMSQLFFSLSVSMGIMITYGSYVKPDVDLNKAVNQIEIFDTGVALLAGAMIIPAVYVFSGTEGMSAGPSLMFVSLPKVFAAMGKAGTFVGILFFVTAIFATLTSCISVLESITANCMEIFHSGRKKTVLVLAVIYLAASAIIALGYSIFYFEVQLPNGSAAQLLDIMDYVSNSVMMPFIALLSTILIGWVMTPDYVIDEMQRNGKTFRRKKLYRVMIRYVAPVMMLVLFLQSTGILA